jgi:hypothetical protein
MEFSTRAAELTTYRLNEIQAGEIVKFVSGVKGIALNLENENVGILVFFFLSLIFFFVSLILIPQVTCMMRETSTTASSSSSSSSNKKEKKRKDFFEEIRSMVLQKLLDYLERNAKTIKDEFPGATHKIESPQFLGKLLQEVLSDVALQDSLRPDQNMRFLREADRVLKESLGDTSYKNCIYDSISHMLKDARKP